MLPNFLLRAALTLAFASTQTSAIFYNDNAELTTSRKIGTNESQSQNIHAAASSETTILKIQTNATIRSNTRRRPAWAGNEPYPLCSCWHTGAPLEDFDEEDEEERDEVNMGYVT